MTAVPPEQAPPQAPQPRVVAIPMNDQDGARKIVVGVVLDPDEALALAQVAARSLSMIQQLTVLATQAKAAGPGLVVAAPAAVRDVIRDGVQRT